MWSQLFENLEKLLSGQRAFNVPPVILLMIAVFTVIHAFVYLWGEPALRFTLGQLAFIPARYTMFLDGTLPFQFEMLWTPFTYGLLHGDLTHLTVNAFWLLVFGSPLAWRFSLARFMVFTLICTALAAFAHGLFNASSLIPMVGASGAISAHTGASLRFAFSRQGTGYGSFGPHLTFRQPALNISQMCRNQTVVIFFVIWLASNLVFIGSGSNVAWIAHIGGFLAGLLLFPLFDPVKGQWQPIVVAENQFEDDLEEDIGSENEADGERRDH